MMGKVMLVAAFIALAAPKVHGQAMPTLNYNPPASLYHDVSAPVESYLSREVNASLQVYPFRSFTGHLQQQFAQTLLRDWIHPDYQEASVAAQPTFSAAQAPGAEEVISGQFLENTGLTQRPRMRVAVLAHHAVALVDISANSMYSWQQAWPGMLAFLNSMKVEAPTTAPIAPSEPGVPRGGIAGVFAGVTTRMMSDLTRGPGYFTREPALQYYIFSPNGRLYRTFQAPDLPGGDVTRFDYRAAAVADPDNSGTYTLDGNTITIRLGGRTPESLTGKMVGANSLLIKLITYERQP
jgi:hypothetical protein